MSQPRFSIVTKLTLLVLAVALPLSGILAWSLLALFRSDAAAAEQRAVSITNAMAIRAEITVGRTRSMLMAVVKRPAVQAMDRAHCDPFLTELRQLMPQHVNINTFNLEWEFVCSAVSQTPGAVVRSDYPELYERMRALDDMVLSAPVRGQLTGKLVVIAAYPVKDAANKLIGAVTAPIDLSVLAPAVADATLPANALTRLIDREGHIVTSYPDIERIGKPAVGVAATAVARKSGTSIEVGQDGVERVYAYTPVNGTSWVAFAGLPTASAFADFRRRRDEVLVALLLVLASAGSLAIVMARQISRPLRELRRDAAVLADGGLAHRSRVESRDEVGQLAASFNDMAQALEAHDAERTKSEQRIHGLNRVYAVLSGITTLIVRVRDRDELFREACRIAVEHGQFQMAWIGVVDRTNMKVVPVASAGAEPGFLTQIKDRFSLSEAPPPGDTMSARAVWEKKAIVSNDIREGPTFFFSKERIGRGILSIAVLPLLVSDEAVGVLALYSDEIGVFDEAELKLLAELAGNIAFAIDHIDKQARLDYLAYYDVLTGLANRSLFLERLAQYMRSAVSGGHKLAVGLIDLERFKNINDSLGRPAGDTLLKQVAEWLTRKLGDVNLSARVGADHFAVVLPKVDEEGDLARLVDKLMAAFLEHPYRLNDSVFRIAIKAGVAIFPDDGSDADTLAGMPRPRSRKPKPAAIDICFTHRR